MIVGFGFDTDKPISTSAMVARKILRRRFFAASTFSFVSAWRRRFESFRSSTKIGG